MKNIYVPISSTDGFQELKDGQATYQSDFFRKRFGETLIPFVEKVKT